MYSVFKQIVAVNFLPSRCKPGCSSTALSSDPLNLDSPHLNGKIERSHKTDLVEFYATQDLHDQELDLRLSEWQHFYNWHRPHSSLSNKTPVEKWLELAEKTPFWDQVEAQYLLNKERIQEQNYKLDLALRKLK